MPKSRDKPAKTEVAPLNSGSGSKQLEASGVTAESRFDSLLAMAVDAIVVVDDDGRIQTFSPAAERLFGYRSSEVLGENVRLLLPEPFRSEFEDDLRSYRGSGAPKVETRRELKALRRDGTVFSIDLSIGHARTAGEDLFVGVIRDLTAKRKDQAAFAESQRALSTFMESFPGMAYRCKNDAAWTMLFASSGTLALTGYVPHAFVDGDVQYADLIHPQDRARVRQAVETALASHKPFDLTYRIRTRSGEERWVFERGVGVYMAEADQFRFIQGLIEDVTERVRSLQQLQESETRLRTIIDLVPQLIFAKDEDGTFILANRAMAEMYGMTVEQLTGQPQRSIHQIPGELDAMLAQDRQVIESGQPLTSLEVEFTDAAGNRRFLQAAKIPFHDAGINRRAVLGVSVDITEQKRTEERLRKRDELIQAAFDHAPVAIITSDLEGAVLTANRATNRILGYSQEELLAMNITDLAYQEYDSQIRDRLRQVRDGKIDEYSEDRQYVRKDGATALGRTHASVVHDASGQPVMLVTQFEDLTKRRSAEREAERLRENLAHVGRLDAMGQMATGIAHEINQPLTAISSYAQACRFMLERDSLDPRRFQEVLDKISRSAKRAGEVIRHLRTLVSQRESLRELAQVNDLVTDVATLMVVDARLVNLRIETQLEEPMPPVVADKVQIQQVVLNLMRNGLDAMREVDSEKRRLVVRTAVRGEAEVEIMVEDRGVGIPSSLEEELFHPFVTTKKSGMGIGLSICQSIIGAHGGRIWFARNQGGGTTFHFTLPTAIEALAGQPKQP